MLTIDEIRRRLKYMNLKAVSDNSGVAYNSVYRVAKSENPEPKHSTIEKLSVFLEGLEGKE